MPKQKNSHIINLEEPEERGGKPVRKIPIQLLAVIFAVTAAIGVILYILSDRIF